MISTATAAVNAAGVTREQEPPRQGGEGEREHDGTKTPETRSARR